MRIFNNTKSDVVFHINIQTNQTFRRIEYLGLKFAPQCFTSLQPTADYAKMSCDALLYQLKTDDRHRGYFERGDLIEESVLHEASSIVDAQAALVVQVVTDDKDTLTSLFTAALNAADLALNERLEIEEQEKLAVGSTAEEIASHNIAFAADLASGARNSVELDYQPDQKIEDDKKARELQRRKLVQQHAQIEIDEATALADGPSIDPNIKENTEAAALLDAMPSTKWNREQLLEYCIAQGVTGVDETTSKNALLRKIRGL